MNTTQQPIVVWTSIVRDDKLLVQSFVERNVSDAVVDTARALMKLPPCLGWSYYPNETWFCSLPNDTCYRGIRFHILENAGTAVGYPRLWTLACVYTSRLASTKVEAQVFLEKLVRITEPLRSNNELWQTGDHHACQRMFGSILKQRMQSSIRVGKSASLDQPRVDSLMDIIESNHQVLEKCHRQTPNLDQQNVQANQEPERQNHKRDPVTEQSTPLQARCLSPSQPSLCTEQSRIKQKRCHLDSRESPIQQSCLDDLDAQTVVATSDRDPSSERWPCFFIPRWFPSQKPALN